MANNVTRMPGQRGAPVGRSQAMPPTPMPSGGGPQQGWWNGTTWTDQCCDGSDGGGSFPQCPPPGWPPPGCPPWYSAMNSPPWYPGANAGVSFGASPPPNPVRGHFWWDGVTMWMFDGAAWVATGGAAAGGGNDVSIGTNPPSSPADGALWFDGAIMYVWNGSAWLPTSGNASGSTPPPNPADGMLWFNGSQLMVWDGNAWIPVSATKSYIQSTPPPTPNPGDTWWNGAQMHIWDGTAWQLVGPGATVGPVATTTNTFAIAQTTVITAASAAWFPVGFTGSPQVDTQTAWNAVNYRLTPKVAGVYAFSLRFYVDIAGQSDSGLAIVKNDGGSIGTTDIYVATTSVYAPATDAGWQQCFGFTSMNGSTDFVRAWVQLSAAGAGGGTIQGSSGNPVFAAWLFP